MARLDANGKTPPLTPDGRYIVVRGRLWRAANPHLSAPDHAALVQQLMQARRAVGMARRAGDAVAEQTAHAQVDAAKQALGERGPPWWDDGAPDLNRRMAANTIYAGWHAGLDPSFDQPRRCCKKNRSISCEASGPAGSV